MLGNRFLFNQFLKRNPSGVLKRKSTTPKGDSVLPRNLLFARTIIGGGGLRKGKSLQWPPKSCEATPRVNDHGGEETRVEIQELAAMVEN